MDKDIKDNNKKDIIVFIALMLILGLIIFFIWRFGWSANQGVIIQ